MLFLLKIHCYRFIQENKFKIVYNDSEKSRQKYEEQIDSVNKTGVALKSIEQASSHENTDIFKDSLSSLGNTSLMGPVVKLPIETNIVMRVEDSICSRHNAKKPKPETRNVNVMSKIEAVSFNNKR